MVAIYKTSGKLINCHTAIILLCTPHPCQRLVVFGVASLMCGHEISGIMNAIPAQQALQGLLALRRKLPHQLVVNNIIASWHGLAAKVALAFMQIININSDISPFFRRLLRANIIRHEKIAKQMLKNLCSAALWRQSQ